MRMKVSTVVRLVMPVKAAQLRKREHRRQNVIGEQGVHVGRDNVEEGLQKPHKGFAEALGLRLRECSPPAMAPAISFIWWL